MKVSGGYVRGLNGLETEPGSATMKFYITSTTTLRIQDQRINGATQDHTLSGSDNYISITRI